MITTTTMMKLNHTFGNIMIDLLPKNQKLIRRAIHIIIEQLSINHTQAKKLYKLSGNNLKVAILSGSGEKAFSAGNDLKHVRSDSDPKVPFGGITSDYICYKPIIAAINGFALGGGLEIALSCDILIASDKSTFGFPEPKVGLFAGAGGAAKLAKLIPQKLALSLLLTGKLINSTEAKNIGVISEIVPAKNILNRAREIANEILKCSPLAISATKQIIYNEYPTDYDPDDIEKKYSEVIKLRDSNHFNIGKKAFANKEDPAWD